ncbi:hypothetical protein IE53DRAFT_386564 [Violaceomyces palustris]|uniref:Uncharacterized protein n=1 Tax=Violaceomyces palustris TaxID=1673888 RepID=A0ACD0NZ53_9BASI|nr:hypothetical protein IE53DRAFT_386564 [Violaceomyces palustris]
MYLHTLPTTGAVSFSDFIITTTFVSEVSKATELRSRLRSVLKEIKYADPQSDNSIISGGGGTSGLTQNPSGEKDWLGVVKAVEEYLPYLFSIFNCVQTDDLILRHEPEFSWRPILVGGSLMRQPQRTRIPGLYYELITTLLLSALSLFNFATSAAISLGDYERDVRLTEAERKSKDERLKWSADTLCKACGIFEYLAEVLIPQWENQVGKVDGRPPEVTREVVDALSKLALAEAQTLAIRKLLSPSLSTSIETTTPGPPLPKNHPSPSLLAKLHLNVSYLLESSLSLCKTAGKKGSSSQSWQTSPSTSSIRGSAGDGRRLFPDTNYQEYPDHGGQANKLVNDDNDGRGEGVGGSGGGGGKKKGLTSKLMNKISSNNRNGGGEGQTPKLSGGSKPVTRTLSNLSSLEGPEPKEMAVSGPILKYLETNANYHKALAYKWLGVDAGEMGGKVGEALTFLKMSRESLHELPTSSGIGLSLGRRVGKDGRKGGGGGGIGGKEEEIKIVDHWIQCYTKLNDTVSFQPLPRAHDLQSKIPAGRAVLSSKKFKPPPPSFGPGSSSQGSRRFRQERPGCQLIGYREEEEEDGGEAQDTFGAIRKGVEDLGLGREEEEEAGYVGAGAYY